MKNKIKISIVTATFNSSNTLSDCLTSIRRQDYKNFEHIVIDGLSTDGTLDIIDNNMDNISNFKSEADQGIYDALNKGLRMATGDVIGFLHSDDLYASNDVLSKIAEIFDDASISAVYGDLIYVNKRNIQKIIRTWRSGAYTKFALYCGWMPAHPTLYVRRECYLHLGGFDPRYRISGDYLSVLQLFGKANFKSVYLPKTMVVMRTGGESNKSVSAVIKKSREDWLALRSVGIGIPGAAIAIALKNLRKIPQFFV